VVFSIYFRVIFALPHDAENALLLNFYMLISEKGEYFIMRKKLVLSIAFIIVCTGLLSGCQKTGKCDFCGNQGKLNEYEFETEKIYICNECKSIGESLE